MHTLRSHLKFNPMQTTLFKSAHTGTCMENGYEMNSIAALSNLFNLNYRRILNQNPELLLANSNIASNAGTLPANLFANQMGSTILDNANLLNAGNLSPTQFNDQTSENMFNLDTINQIRCLQNGNNRFSELPTSLFNLQNSATFDLTRAIQLASELTTSSTSLPQSPFQSLLQAAAYQQPIPFPTININIAQPNSSSSSNRPNKRQKSTPPNPIQLTYSNFNSEQVQPLDLSIRSASSSTNSECFILEPLNLSRSNSPEQTATNENTPTTGEPINNEVNISNVQLQNLCKKKKIMLQTQLAKQSSSSSAPCSPSSSEVVSSPANDDQTPNETENSQSNQSSGEVAQSTTENVQQVNKKRKLSDSSFSVDSQATNNSTNSAPRTQNVKRRATRRSVTSEESTSDDPSDTVIIDATSTFDCSICNEMFAYKDRLSKHIKSKHRDHIEANQLISGNQQSNGGGRNSPNQRNYQCPICDRGFSRSDMLTRHSRVHSGLKPYTCDICNSEFTRSDHLATHKRTHSGEKPYKCSKCTYTACRRDMITRHMKTHNNDKNGKTSHHVVLLATTKKNVSPSSSEIVSKKSQTKSSTNSNTDSVLTKKSTQLETINETQSS